jgi:hypothetical protein
MCLDNSLRIDLFICMSLGGIYRYILCIETLKYMYAQKSSLLVRFANACRSAMCKLQNINQLTSIHVNVYLTRFCVASIGTWVHNALPTTYELMDFFSGGLWQPPKRHVVEEHPPCADYTPLVVIPLCLSVMAVAWGALIYTVLYLTGKVFIVTY